MFEQQKNDNDMAALLNKKTIFKGAVYTKKYRYTEKESSRNDQVLTIKIIPVNPWRDTHILHQWMNAEHVRKYWQQAWSIAKINDYLVSQSNSYHDLYLVYVNNSAIGYTEIYPVMDDPLKNYARFNNQDYGWHFLIGPKNAIGSGLSNLIAHCILSFIFDKKMAIRIYCEPDVKNKRMINFVEKLAHKDMGSINMKHKQAQLMVCHIDDFLSLTIPSIALTSTVKELL